MLQSASTRGYLSARAHDLPSAFSAMKQGAGIPPSVQIANMDRVPVIVFHGDRDTTVDPCNGEAVIAQCLGAAATVSEVGSDALRTTVERGSVPRGRAYTRTVFRNPDGSVTAEQWVVHGAAHAWFGGDPAGSYTDPTGPDAVETHAELFFCVCTFYDELTSAGDGDSTISKRRAGAQ